jgi:hypothetical protein
VNDSSRFKPADGIIYREEGQGGFLFDPKTGNLKYMNLSAKESFLLVDGMNSVAQIARLLSRRYPEIDPPSIQRDVEQFLEELEKDRFIDI